MVNLALKLSDVSHRFAQTWALLHASVSIAWGQAVLLTGANGAGKTTLLRLMATTLQPTHGTVEIFGCDASEQRQPLRRGIGLMTHQHFMYESLSARENLHFVCRLARPQAHAKVTPLLETTGLQAVAQQPVGSFSAGMKRRLALARLLLLEPALLLLDEPFGQLDPPGVELMLTCIDAWRAQAKTLVISTHDVERGMALCGRHLHLDAQGLCERTGARAT